MWCLTTDRGHQKHFLVVLVEDTLKLDNRNVYVRRVIACIHHSHVMRCVYRAYSSTYGRYDSRYDGDFVFFFLWQYKQCTDYRVGGKVCRYSRVLGRQTLVQ